MNERRRLGKVYHDLQHEALAQYAHDARVLRDNYLALRARLKAEHAEKQDARSKARFVENHTQKFCQTCEKPILTATKKNADMLCAYRGRSGRYWPQVLASLRSESRKYCCQTCKGNTGRKHGLNCCLQETHVETPE